MPYKSESIKITGTQYDRRIKLNGDDRVEIKKKYSNGMSLRALAREYHVDKKTIKFVVDWAYYEHCKEVSRKYDYVETKEQRASYMRNHRSYKQSLYLAGKINHKERKNE